MGKETQIDPDVVVSFVKFCDEQYGEYEPFTDKHDKDFKVSAQVFGAASDTSDYAPSRSSGPAMGPVYTYEPMRPHEFEKAWAKVVGDDSGLPKELNPDKDPGGAMADWKEGFAFWWGTNEDGQLWEWFYECGGKVSGGEKDFDYYDSDAVWAKPTQKIWNSAVDDRLSEVGALRDELAYLIWSLSQVTEEMKNVDVENAAGIDLSDYEYAADDWD